MAGHKRAPGQLSQHLNEGENDHFPLVQDLHLQTSNKQVVINYTTFHIFLFCLELERL